MAVGEGIVSAAEVPAGNGNRLAGVGRILDARITLKQQNRVRWVVKRGERLMGQSAVEGVAPLLGGGGRGIVEKGLRLGHTA